VVVAPDRFCTDQTPQLINLTYSPAIHVISSPPETRRTAAIYIYLTASDSSHHRGRRSLTHRTAPHHHNHYHTHLDIAKGARTGKRRTAARDYIPPHIQGLLVLILLLRSAHTSYHVAPIHAPTTTTHQSMNIASSTRLLLPSLPVPFAAPPRPA
jgi:hypothetical protein